jgi:hypothetical protein
MTLALPEGYEAVNYGYILNGDMIFDASIKRWVEVDVNEITRAGKIHVEDFPCVIRKEIGRAKVDGDTRVRNDEQDPSGPDTDANNQDDERGPTAARESSAT